MPVLAGYTASAAYYNNLRSIISSVLGTASTGYGYTGGDPSLDVTAGVSLIKADDWIKLYNETNKCVIHQTNSAISLGSGINLPSVGAPVYVNFISALETLINQVYANRTTVHPSQLGQDSVTGTRTGSWGSTIDQTVTYTWPTNDAGTYFFNLGGKIDVQLSYPAGSYSGYDLIWANLIDTANPILAAAPYNLTNYTVGTPVVVNAATNGVHSIRVTYTKLSAAQVRVYVELITTLGPGESIALDVTSTVSYYYSRGDAGPAPYGVAAPRPDVTVVAGDLENGGSITPILKTLSITPASATYNDLRSDSTSPATTFTIANLGNVNVTLSNITGSNNSVTPVIVENWAGSPKYPKSIAPGDTVTISVSYSAPSAQVGSYSNSITVYSDNDLGPVSISTIQNVILPVFDFTLSPSTWNQTVTDLNAVYQVFSIVPSSPLFSNLAWSAVVNANFSVSNTPTPGPLVSFSPVGKFNGTYNTNIDVTVNSITRTATASIIRNVPETRNLGTWLSAGGYFNSVVGMSYDLIGGIRYLTIGVGGSGDGAPDVWNNGYNYMSAANLNYAADDKYSYGMVINRPNPPAAWSSFMQTYSVWQRQTAESPYYAWWYRTYTFYAPETKTYLVQYAADNNGVMYLNGVLMTDNANSFRGFITFECTLVAGNNTVTFGAYNTGGPGGIAIRIYDYNGTDIWNTLVPVRSSLPYAYWKEVYRIPLTAGAAVYESRNYLIKDTGAIQVPGDYSRTYQYGEFFSSGSQFLIADDGSGNITITMNSLNDAAIPQSVKYTTTTYGYEGYETTSVNTDYVTLTTLPTTFYYWYGIPGQGYNRINNLEQPASDGTTNYFIGFDAAGNVRTSRVAAPGYVASSGGGGGGGGCPAPWHKILLGDESLINAGYLQVGMLVKTRHETTLEMGIFKVTAVEIQNDSDRVEITFDDGLFTCSPTHRFYVGENVWKHVYELKTNDIIGNKKVLEVRSIDPGAVVKITVEDAHTYICEGMLSHNVKWIWDGGGYVNAN